MARYIDPLVFSLSSKSPDQLRELQSAYAEHVRSLRGRQIACWWRNRAGVVVAVVGVIFVGSLGFATTLREGSETGMAELIVGWGWFFGVIYFGNRWQWFNETARRWKSEELSLRDELEMNSSTLAQIEQHLG